MGVIKNMLEDIEMENYIDSESDAYDDLEITPYDEEYEKMMEAERKSDELYQALYEKDNIAREFPNYNPENVPKFGNQPTLGGCLLYILFQLGIVLVIYLIVSNL